MKTLSVSEAKMKLSALVEGLRVTDEEVLITKNGEPVAVPVSPEEFDGWRETLAVRNDAELLVREENG
jgi:prevent-host-death family protein